MTLTGFLLPRRALNSFFVLIMTLNLQLAHSESSLLKQKVNFSELPGWGKGDFVEGFSAFLKTCQGGPEQAPSGWHLKTWEKICKEASTIQKDNKRKIQN